MVHHVMTYTNGEKSTLATMWANVSIVPFESILSLFCVLSGIFGLAGLGLNNDQFSEALGTTLATIFNIGYIFAGLGMFFGIALNRKDIEVSGLTAIVTSLLVRSATIAWAVGLNTVVVTSYVFNILFISACITRAYMIFKFKVIVQKVISDERNNVA